MNAGELAELTASGLEALTAEDLTSSGGSDTESTWTEAQISEVMSELDSILSQVGTLQTAISDAVSTIISHGDSNWKTAEGFATPEDVPTAEEVSSSVWSAESRTLTSADGLGLASSSAVVELNDLLQLVISLAGNWSATSTTLTVYDSAGSQIGTWALTRDSNGIITKIAPNN